ncbi:MAG: hypothetical protein AAFY71_05675 [Bacteroidota bacterium]
MKSKFFVLISLVFLCVSSAPAQNFGGEHPHWTYSYTNFCKRGFVELIDVGDSTYLGKNWQLLKKTYRVYDFCTNQEQVLEDGQLDLILQDGRRVFYVTSSGQVDTLFDFNLMAGQSYQITFPNSLPLFASISDTGRINYQEQNLFYQEVTYTFDSQLTYHDTLIEGIGGTKEYLFPWDMVDRQVDGHVGGPFVCFANDTFDYNQLGSNCSAIVLSEEWAGNKAELMYLSSEEYLKILESDEKEYIWEIYDLQGRQVLHRKGGTLLSINGLSRGYYIARALHPRLSRQLMLRFIKK